MVSNVKFILTPKSNKEGSINIVKNNKLVAKFPVMGDSVKHMECLTKRLEKTHEDILSELLI